MQTEPIYSARKVSSETALKCMDYVESNENKKRRIDLKHWLWTLFMYEKYIIFKLSTYTIRFIKLNWKLECKGHLTKVRINFNVENERNQMKVEER